MAETKYEKLPKSSQETMYRRKGTIEKSAQRWARATSLDPAREESSKKLKAVVEDVETERKIVSSARNMLVREFGQKTPAELINAIVASVEPKDPGVINQRVSNFADTILKRLYVIRNAISILKQDIPVTLTRGKEFSRLPGIYSELKAQYDKAFGAISSYVAYWEYVKQNGKLPGFFNFGTSKYNSRSVSYVVNTIFLAEEAVVNKLFEGLDILSAAVMKKR
jgi:hypothetical protein